MLLFFLLEALLELLLFEFGELVLARFLILLSRFVFILELKDGGSVK